jgi:hypothetical protein
MESLAMIRKLQLTLLLSLSTAGAICASPQPCAPPPPPEFWLTIQSAEPIDSPLRVGQEYLIYMRRDTETTYRAAIIGKSGEELYRDRPVYWSGCAGSSVVWSNWAAGYVRTITVFAGSGGKRDHLVLYASPQSPCMLSLDLSAGLDGIPSRPNPGIPDSFFTFCPLTRTP